MSSLTLAFTVTLIRAYDYPRPPMDTDREPHDEALVSRDFDALLHIAVRGEVPVPAGLASAAFERAFARRQAGVWDGFVADDDIRADESYARALAQFDVLARALTAREWQAPVATYGTVHDLVAHLLAIEIYTGKQVGLFDAEELGDDNDHVHLGDELIRQWQASDDASLLARWRDYGQEIVHTLAARPHLLSAAASWHGAPIDVQSLLIIRTFELWMHADDVRAATGRPRREPDNGQLKLMTNLAAHILPLGLELIGRAHPGRSVRLVLTGRGGGTWRCPLGLASPVTADDDVVLVADAIDFCRLAGNRCTPSDLEVYVEGDEALASDILQGMTALAAD
jgi:uncharacterized protein (TIGR03083 family)